ncbi:MAG: enoyl-CoA hydratase/isomerase family protein [Deltaproteobacteria bacterium]|nr:enoyl-CoA hydratase/isomerase family protein [Deltaproteobacteria bacterium]
MAAIQYRKDGRIGRLTLNRPESYNAVDYPMVDELEAFWRDRGYDNDTGVVILDGGVAKGFCAGLDMKTFAPVMFAKDTTAMYNEQRRLSRVLLAMRQAPQPIIACVHGSAAGLGFSMAMASDVRIVTPDARFSAAYINIGLGGADMACSYFLPRLIGSGRAAEFMLTGNWMSADDAMHLGFASRMVPKEKLLEAADAIANTMLEKNPLGLRMTKEALNVSIDAPGLEAALEMEDRNQLMLILDKKLTGAG